jgi:hypothetical protein
MSKQELTKLTEQMVVQANHLACAELEDRWPDVRNLANFLATNAERAAYLAMKLQQEPKHETN